MSVYGDITPRTAGKAMPGFLMRALPYLVLEKYLDLKPLPSNSTKVAIFRRYEALEKATTPLVEGVTNVVVEAEFDAQTWYSVLERERISVWYTAPTAIRMMMKLGAEALKRYDVSALRFMASVGEPLNPAFVPMFARAGASHIVCGRPITAANDPRDAARRVAEEMLGV